MKGRKYSLSNTVVYTIIVSLSIGRLLQLINNQRTKWNDGKVEIIHIYGIWKCIFINQSLFFFNVNGLSDLIVRVANNSFWCGAGLSQLNLIKNIIQQLSNKVTKLIKYVKWGWISTRLKCRHPFQRAANIAIIKARQDHTIIWYYVTNFGIWLSLEPLLYASSFTYYHYS